MPIELKASQRSMFLRLARELAEQELRPSRSLWRIVDQARADQIEGLPDPRKPMFTRAEARRLAMETAAQLVVRFLARYAHLLDANSLKPLEFEHFEWTLRRLEDALPEDDPGRQDLETMRRYHELNRCLKPSESSLAPGGECRRAAPEPDLS